VNPKPVVTVSPTSSTICTLYSGVNLTASGASSYSWSPGTGLSSTVGATVNANPPNNVGLTTSMTYTVTGSNGSCSSSASTIVYTNYTPTTSIWAESATTFCEGNSVRLNAWCEANVTYQWFRNDVPIYTNPWEPHVQTATVSGDYKVTITSNFYACSYTTPATTVTVIPAPEPYITQAFDHCSYGYTVLTANAGPGVTSYQWSTNENSQSIYGYPGYEYYVTAYYGSCSSTAYVYLSTCEPQCPDPYNPNCPCVDEWGNQILCQAARKRQDNSDEEVEEELSTLGIYPNPANGEVNVQILEAAATKLEVMMVSQMGSRVRSSSIPKGEKKTVLDTRDVADGIYIVLLKSPKGTVISQKVIIKH
jgi:hypothetical protein